MLAPSRRPRQRLLLSAEEPNAEADGRRVGRRQPLFRAKERFGHCRVSKGDWANPSLAAWVNALRVAHRKGALRPDRQERLEALGFEWSLKGGGALAELWEQRFTELQAFLQTHGHTRVPKRHKVLWHWRLVQREFRRNGRLSAERIARLDALGFDWGGRAPGVSHLADREARWNLHFEHLCAFQQRFGHSRVPRHWAEHPHLPQWLQEQRRAGQRGRLLPERRARLDSLDLTWAAAPDGSRADSRGERRLAELAAYRERFGHSRVPIRWTENPGLGDWLAAQRHLHRRGRLTAGRIAQLEALGCEWRPQSSPRTSGSSRGDRRLAQLAAFRERFGHTRVPIQWPEDPGLGEWASSQRALRRQGGLKPERLAQLEALGFEWERQPRPRTAAPSRGDRRLAQLAAFRERFGHACVPLQWPDDPSLGQWVCTQRARRRQGRLDPRRLAALDALGFDWRSRPGPRGFPSPRGDRRLRQLAAFRERFGHTRVPRKWPEEPGLGDWVHYQRQFLRKGKLPPQRLAQLAALGFA